MSSFGASPGGYQACLAKMAIAMCNAARYFLIGKFNFERVKKRLFHSLGMRNALVKRLADLRIQKPTAIQEKVSKARVDMLRMHTCQAINDLHYHL